MHMFKRSSNGLGNSAKCVRCGGIFRAFHVSISFTFRRVSVRSPIARPLATRPARTDGSCTPQSKARLSMTTSDAMRRARRDEDADCARRNRALLVLFCCVEFVGALAINAPLPFLSTMLERSGCTPTQLGVVFSALPLAILVGSPIVAPVLWRVGALRIFTGSMFALILSLLVPLLISAHEPCGVGEGLVACDKSKTFIITTLWTLSRFGVGLVEAFISVTCLCLITRHMPQRMASAYGAIEFAMAVGGFVGPALGGWLYEIHTSPTLPSIAIAMAVAMEIPYVYSVSLQTDFDAPVAKGVDVEAQVKSVGYGSVDNVALPRRQGSLKIRGGGEGVASDAKTEVKRRNLLTRPLFIACVILTMTLSAVCGVIDVTIPLHWEKSLGMNEGAIGSAFAVQSAIQAVCSLLVGPIIEEGLSGSLSEFALGGSTLCALGFFFFGPSRNLPLSSNSQWRGRGWQGWTTRVYIASTLYAVGRGIAEVPLLPLMQESVSDLGAEYTEAVAGLFNVWYYLGEMIGTGFGAEWGEMIGYESLYSVAGFGMVLAGTVFLTVRILSGGC